MGAKKLEDIVGSIDTLPTLPSVVSRVNELVDDPTASAGDINDVISHDLALSSKILKLVNSAFYGFPRRISSITHAVVILGFQTVRNIALSAFVLDAFDTGGLPFGYRNFWIHSVGVGVAANAVGARHGVPVGDDAFMCGLLHDIGKLVVFQYLNEDFVKVLAKVEAEDITLVEAESAVLEAGHAEVGALLMEQWQLPEKMVAVLRYHHQPDAAPEEAAKLVSAVHCADILTRALLIGSGGDQKIPIISEAAWDALGLTEEALPEILKDIAADMGKVEAFIELIQTSSNAK
jgi:putative nucleotidyltransferase with HDIG domain